MIVVVRRSNVAMLALVFLLSLAIYWLNAEDMKERAVSTESNGKHIVVIDAGHGGIDPGAVSDYSSNKEKDLNLDIAQKVSQMLKDEGIEVVMTRTKDVLEFSSGAKSLLQKRKEDLLRRKSIMDNSGADIVVSIHMNKFPEDKYWGIQSFFPPNSAESEKLACLIQECVHESIQPESTRQALVNDRGIIILKNLKTVTAIVECGFLSNKDEDAKLMQEEYRQKVAEAIKAGIMKYFEPSAT